MKELTEVLTAYPARLIVNTPVDGDRLAQFLRREPVDPHSNFGWQTMHSRKSRERDHG